MTFCFHVSSFKIFCWSLCRIIKSSVGDLESTSCTDMLITGLLLSALWVEGRFWCYVYAAHIQSTWLSAACSVWYTQEKEPFLSSTPTRQISPPNITSWSPSGGAAESGEAAAAAVAKFQITPGSLQGQMHSVTECLNDLDQTDISCFIFNIFILNLLHFLSCNWLLHTASFSVTCLNHSYFMSCILI